MKIETLAIRATAPPHDTLTGVVTSPIQLSTTYERQPDGSLGPYVYTRANNPNRQTLEHALAALEGGQVALAFGSGQAATMTLLQSLRPGDHVIAPHDAYYGSLLLMQDLFGVWGLDLSKVDTTDLAQVRSVVRPSTKLIWLESPSNPLLSVSDIEAVAALAHEHGAICAVDNTWATPVLQRPLELGADVVMHSTTKYFGGHSDLLGGALVLKENGDLAERLRKIQTTGGAVPSAFDCWLVARGIRTLPLRVRTAATTAQQIADFLANHPAVESVYYPGLASHPAHDLASRQMQLPGAMLSIEVKGGEKAALQLASALRLFTHATSLGGVESLIEHRRSVEGDVSLSPPGLLRISVGLEHPDDLIADLAQALGQLEP